MLIEINIGLKVETKNLSKTVSDPKLLTEQVVDFRGIWQYRGIIGKIENENREKKRKIMMTAKFLVIQIGWLNY